MDDCPSLKRRKLLPSDESEVLNVCQGRTCPGEEENDSTDVKLAILASLFPSVENVALLDILVESNGSIHAASQILSSLAEPASRKLPIKGIGYQTSLESFRKPKPGPVTLSRPAVKDALTRKGQTLHLYTPEDIESHTPCSIIHNFLPAEIAEDLLRELLQEASTFERQVFKLFDNVDIRQITPQMSKVSASVQAAVNGELSRRIQYFYPGGKKLRYQSPKDWIPNAAFVNQYQGGSESVGYHSDQLTYLGPRAVIGSLSLGVARQFRIRKIVARDEQENQPRARTSKDMQRADAEGQIAIHLPHNSLLVMHAEMQEEYKHILRCVQRKKENRGRYMWMCHAGLTPGKEGCTFFQWAEFDDDGEPQWAKTSEKA
ncbi:MAG: hypothetical protein L6R37_001470 [Teloschistes peruensis]|nr:MAG: hypothetical protein L6R37_001470 [Teloschistes peruensis]